MKYNPAEHWTDKIRTVTRLVARGRARIAPSAAARAYVAEIERRRRLPVAQLLDEPLGDGEKAGDKLLRKAVDTMWWAGEIDKLKSRRAR